MSFAEFLQVHVGEVLNREDGKNNLCTERGGKEGPKTGRS